MAHLKIDPYGRFVMQLYNVIKMEISLEVPITVSRYITLLLVCHHSNTVASIAYSPRPLISELASCLCIPRYVWIVLLYYLYASCFVIIALLGGQGGVSQKVWG